MPSTAEPRSNIDRARDAGVRMIRRAAYAAAPDVSKSLVDIGAVAFASAVVKELQGRLETAQQLDWHGGRRSQLAVIGQDDQTALTMYLPASTGQVRPSRLIIPGQATPDASTHANSTDRERFALARPLPNIIADALTTDQTWHAVNAAALREISVHPGQGDVLILLAMQALRRDRRAQRVLQREALRPVYHLNEAENSPPHTTAVILSMRASDQLDRHFPLQSPP